MMTEAESVDGDGWISDESSFYGQCLLLNNHRTVAHRYAGDQHVCSHLEQKAKRELTLPYFPFARITALAAQRCQRENPNDRSVAVARATSPQVPSSSSKETKHALSESKFMQLPNWGEVVDFLQDDRLKDHSACWQPDEDISSFLERAPVADERTARFGPWLWVRNPEPTESLKAPRPENIVDFIDQGKQLLHNFAEQRSEEDGDDSSRTKLTRRMRMRRDKLEEDLLAAAGRTGTTCGRWMLFPGREDLKRSWCIVAEATSTGRLGPLSKVATYSPGKDETLICVYTYDFSDLDDVRRVLTELKDYGLVPKSGKPIYYKCDAYTYLEITSNNSYNLRASVFSSKEVFENAVRVQGEGPIAQAKKRNN